MRWAARRCEQAEVPGCLPSWLTLSPDGTLTGMIPLDEQTYRIQLSALVDTAVAVNATFELTASHRCWSFALVEREDRAEVVAQRVDAGMPATSLAGLLTGETVSDFNLSGDGRYLAATVQSATGQLRLALFEVHSERIVEVPVVGAEGSYVAHAFSPDSSALALVTADTSVAAATLSVGRLGPGALAFGQRQGVDYVAGLTWSDASTILYLGGSIPRVSGLTNEPLHTPHEVRVPATGLTADTQVSDFVGLFVEPSVQAFYGLWPNPGGFFLQTNQALDFYDRCLGRPLRASIVGLDTGTLSPRLDWVALTSSGQVSLQHYGSVQNVDRGCDTVTTRPSAACGEVLAWSENGTALLCVSDGRLTSLNREGDVLVPTEIAPELVYDSIRAERRALSATGRWIALDIEASTSRPGGVYLVDALLGSAPARLVLPPDNDAIVSNLGFTSDERYLVAHKGSGLYAFDVEAPSGPVGVLSESMRPVPTCRADGVPDPDVWCGSPRLVAGPVVLSTSGRFVAFQESNGDAWVSEVANPSQRHSLSSTVGACSGQPTCVKFQ